jgi:hypothetical protein
MRRFVLNYKRLKLNLYSLAKSKKQLSEIGGPENNGLLFEDTIALEELILNQFGLPICSRYLHMFEFFSKPDDIEINFMISQFELEAKMYLSSSVSTNNELLKAAYEDQIPASEILPELKIPMHIYTVFVYDNILLKSRDTFDNILEELNKVKQGEILDSIGRLVEPDAELNKLAFNYLEDQNLKYLQAFVLDRFGLMSHDEYWSLVGMGVELRFN